MEYSLNGAYLYLHINNENTSCIFTEDERTVFSKVIKGIISRTFIYPKTAFKEAVLYDIREKQEL